MTGFWGPLLKLSARQTALFWLVADSLDRSV